MRLVYVFALPLLVASACLTPPRSLCYSDGDCPRGRCLTSPYSHQGFCAFPDADGMCGSGLVWGSEAADGLARTCVATNLGSGSDLLSTSDGPGHFDMNFSSDMGNPINPVDLTMSPCTGACPTDLAGASWTPQLSGTPWNLNGVYGVYAGYVLAVGENGTVLHTPGNGVWLADMSGTTQDLHAVWGWKGGLYAVGNQGSLLFNTLNSGVPWTTYPTGTARDLYAVWGLPPQGAAFSVYVAGQGGTLLRSAKFVGWGGGPATVPNQRNLLAIWGDALSDVFVVGDFDGKQPTVLHAIDGLQFQQQSATSPPQLLDGIWGSSGVDVYAVGVGGAVLHFDGMSWSLQGTSSMQRLRGVWGSSAGDIYAVGDGGLIVHSTGHGDWTVMASGTTQSLNGVWGSSAGDIYVVGTGGTILHHP